MMQEKKSSTEGNSAPSAPTNKSQQRKDNVKRLYIRCAESIIRREGMKALNIRRIASEVGYNSATLYNYFEDIDELIMFVTFRYRRDYLMRLSKEILPEMTSLQQYVKLYEVYCDFSFSYPEIYYNMYFGRYSHRLESVREEYYRLFPEEFVPQTDLVQALLTQKNVYEGDMAALRYLAADGYIQERNISYVANLIIRAHSSYMHDLFVYPHLSVTLCVREFMDLLMHVLDTN